jgi:hypothetical protein
MPKKKEKKPAATTNPHQSILLCRMVGDAGQACAMLSIL